MQDLHTRTIINHIGLVADESISMRSHQGGVVKGVDAFVRHLADTSRVMNQETRISFYAFNSRGTDRCLVFDTDVLRIPSIEGKYRPQGNTALIDCTCRTIDDLKKIPDMYGEHSFWVAAFTDGEENNSRKGKRDLQSRINELPAEWTVSAYVPDDEGRRYAEGCGFHPGNIEQWDTAGSFEQISASLRQTADRFMQGREQGIRGYKTGGLFQMNQVDPEALSSVLTPLAIGSYLICEALADIDIRDFVPLYANQAYVRGRAYYEFESRTEMIQPDKEIAIRKHSDNRVYVGPAARSELGLPAAHAKVKPGAHPGYTIFVQSNSYTRKVRKGQAMLVLR